MTKTIKIQKRIRRHRRVRAKINGTAQQPRLCVFRSNKHIYAQVINDEKGKTLIAVSDLELKKLKVKSKKEILQLKSKKNSKKQPLSTKVHVAFRIGQLLAQKALKKKIKQVIFDRGGYKYHGRVKTLAEGARKGGLKF